MNLNLNDNSARKISQRYRLDERNIGYLVN